MAFKMKGFSAFTKTDKTPMYKDKSPMYGHKSHMYKMDPPEQQEKIIKMIQTGIQKDKSDKEIMKKINKMSDGKNTYEYNRKTGEVQVKGEHPREGKGTKNQGDYEPAFEGGD